MKFKANFVEKPLNFQMDDCQIEKVVELSHEDFCRLKITPLDNQPFIRGNKDCMFTNAVFQSRVAPAIPEQAPPGVSRTGKAAGTGRWG